MTLFHNTNDTPNWLFRLPHAQLCPDDLKVRCPLFALSGALK